MFSLYLGDYIMTDDGGTPDTETEFGFELEGKDSGEHKHPANRRAGTHSSAKVLEEDELAQEAQKAESEYGDALENQKEREIGFRDLKRRLENNAGDENQPVNRFLADATETGLAGVDDDWEIVSSEYLEEDGEPLEFAQEDQGLMDYFQTASGAIDNLSEQVTQFTGLISNVTEREQERVEELESEIQEAEERKEKRIREAEAEKEEEVDGLKSQVANMSTSDLDDSTYEEPNDMWQQEWDDISGSFSSTVEQAESEYDETEAELEAEKEEVQQDAEEQRSTLRNQKQSLVSERADRLDELEEVHVEFSNDVIEYAEEQKDGLEDLVITLRSLENMRGDYGDNSVAEALEGSSELSQDQQAISQDINTAATAVAYRALERIDNLEDAVSDYARADEAITDRLDEQEARVGTRLDEVVDIYDDLALEDISGDDDYGINALRERVQSHVENATNTEYDAVEEFREEVESMARTPT